MLPPVCDRPPLRTDVIAAKMQEQVLPPGLMFERTTRLPSFAIHPEVRERKTNTSPDLSIASARLASLASEAMAELDRYLHFGAGWDGYSAEPIAPTTILFARLFVALLGTMKPSRLTDIIPGPAPDGSLDLDLRAETRRLIITMYPGTAPDSVQIRTFRTDAVTSEEKHDLEPDALVADLRWLLA